MPKPFLAFSAATFALAGCTSIGDLPTERVGTATLSFANGLPAGTARLFSNGSSVTLGIAATGLQPGAHGFHLHTTGRCEAPGFKSAGGHLNPGDNTHGFLSSGGSHLGDLPNLEVGSSGTATTTVDIGNDPERILDEVFDADGTAVIIHAGPDDYRTDPAGDAGARVACGVLRRN